MARNSFLAEVTSKDWPIPDPIKISRQEKFSYLNQTTNI